MGDLSSVRHRFLRADGSYGDAVAEWQEAHRLGDCLGDPCCPACRDERGPSVCTCGHDREEHWATTGREGSFGGSACKLCWTCGTFTDAPPLTDQLTPRGRA